jgi:hypothetical protein
MNTARAISNRSIRRMVSDRYIDKANFIFERAKHEISK